jgi:hypothetical protein
MPMLACIHNASWVIPAPNHQHQCLYCRAFVTKKDVYPKWDDLGADYQKQWDAHEKVEAAPAPADAAKPAA